jgi:hypothetical protein
LPDCNTSSYLLLNPESSFSLPPGWVREPARTAGRRQGE